MKPVNITQLAIIVTLLLLCGAAFATSKPPPPAANAVSDSSSAATSTSSPIANSYGSTSGDAWAVSLPGHGSPSYAGMYSICVKGRGMFLNAFWTWDPDLDCVREIARLTQMLQTPVPKPTSYPMADAPLSASSDEVRLVQCDPPATDKPVRTAAAKGNKDKGKVTLVKVASTRGCGK